jgi:Protein of unknown function (DUF3800)
MYTIVIDESGDTGLNGVEPDPSYGPTQYFCLCATFFRDENRSQIENRLAELPFGNGSPHANKLNHFEKAYYCKVLSDLPIGMLGAISNKLSLLSYLPQASKTPTHFYNKVMQYLLERVGEAMAKLGIKGSEVRILLEARAQQYSSLLSFIDNIQKNPHDTRSIAVRNIDRFSVSSIKKKDDKCMALSDVGANAIFCAVRRDKRSFGMSETRYLNELRHSFLADKTGKIFPSGIKPIHSISDLQLPEDTAQFLAGLTNPKRDYHRLA